MDVEQFKDDIREERVSADRIVDVLSAALRELQKAQAQLAQTQSRLAETQAQLEQAQARIAELEEQLGRLGQPATPKLDESYSVGAEEKRQAERDKKQAPKRKPPQRRGRITTAEKIAQAVRTETVYPQGAAPEECKLSHTRVVWRLENGQAVLVAYDVYRAGNEYGQVPNVIGRSEFGIEILITIAHLVYVVGLSFDKVCMLLNFFQNLKLRKSQVDALLNQLSQFWESEFDALCTLLANSAVVHADETGWSLNSVWAFLSEQARVLFFGVHKDAETLNKILDPATFAGIVISDDAAVYLNFTKSQKCWAHLLRKAIKLTLLDPEVAEYRHLTDRLLEIYRAACRVQQDKRYGDVGRAAKVCELTDQVVDLVIGVWGAELPPHQDGSLEDYRKLCNELMRLAIDEQLFVFVTAPATTAPNGETQPVAGTNNEAERTLRNPAGARDTQRTTKSVRGARRRTVIFSVLESTRQYLPTFTLTTLLAEIERWMTQGRSCFTKQLQRLKRKKKGRMQAATASLLDVLFPLPESI